MTKGLLRPYCFNFDLSIRYPKRPRMEMQKFFSRLNYNMAGKKLLFC